MPNNTNGDETNVEAYASNLAAQYPYDDPHACWEIHQQEWKIVELNLANRAARHARQKEEDDRIERSEPDD